MILHNPSLQKKFFLRPFYRVKKSYQLMLETFFIRIQLFFFFSFCFSLYSSSLLLFIYCVQNTTLKTVLLLPAPNKISIFIFLFVSNIYWYTKEEWAICIARILVEEKFRCLWTKNNTLHICLVSCIYQTYLLLHFVLQFIEKKKNSRLTES